MWIFVSIFVIIGLVGISLIAFLGFKIILLQNINIAYCLEFKQKSGDLLTGKLAMSHISDNELVSLSRPKYIIVGMGGLVLGYSPSLTIVCMAEEELNRRKANRLAGAVS